jgi:TRAP-type C4-dicarboxylate transport system permease small subunit
MNRLETWLTRFADVIAGALLTVVTLLVCAQVLVRYVLGGSLVWSEELTRLTFVWMVLIASTSAQPMRVDLFVDLLPRRARAVVYLLGELLVLALTLLLLYGAWGMMDLTQFDTYPALSISVRWLHTGLFVAAILWALRGIANIAARLREVTA